VTSRKFNGTNPKLNAKKKRDSFRNSYTTYMDKDKKIDFKGPSQNFGDDGNIQIETIIEELSPQSKDKTPISKKIILPQEISFPEEEKIIEKTVKPISEISFEHVKELERIGQGSFGVVLKALYVPSNLVVALKVK